MVSFLLIISFLLHIVSLFAIFQLFKLQQSASKESDSQEVMEVLEIYLGEIKEENNRLQNLIEKQSQQLEDVNEEKQMVSNQVIKENTKAEPGFSDLDALIEDVPEYQVDASLESRVLQLHSKGKTIEEIAKTLDCGKTEAELIIKLYRK